MTGVPPEGGSNLGAACLVPRESDLGAAPAPGRAGAR